MTTFYAIKDTISGAYLPRYAGNKGGTWVEFSTTLPPRLFTRKRDATSSLNHWLKGQQGRVWNNFDRDYDIKITPRDLSSIAPAVVPVTITQC